MEVFATGIFSIHDMEEYLDSYNGINECYLEHLKECKEEYHDNCWEDQPEDPIWYGYTYDEDKDELVPDDSSDFQAVNRGNTYQVCNSKHLIVGCKSAFQGCYPGFQAYFDEEDIGGITAYAFTKEDYIEKLRPLIITVAEYNCGKQSIAVFDEKGSLDIWTYDKLRSIFHEKYTNNVYPDAPSAVYAAILEYDGTIYSYAHETYSKEREDKLPSGTRAMLHILRGVPEFAVKGIGYFYDHFYDRIHGNVLNDKNWSQSGKRMLKLAFNMFNGYKDSDEYDLYWLTRGLDSVNMEVVRQAIWIFLT